MKGTDKFCMIVLEQIKDSLLDMENVNGSCEHTANDLPTFSPQKRNLEIRPSERLLPVSETKNWILKNGSCERALRDMAKQLLTPLRLIARMNFLLKNYSFELLNLTGTVGKVELISTFTTAVCESWNLSDKYTWDNSGDLKQLSIEQTLSKAWCQYKS